MNILLPSLLCDTDAMKSADLGMNSTVLEKSEISDVHLDFSSTNINPLSPFHLILP